MKLANKTIYGLRALFDLAFFSQNDPIQLQTIANREEIPTRFLEQILQDLKRAGLVQSKRGPKGGYSLDKAPEQITLLMILKALDDAPCYMCAEATGSILGPNHQVSITDSVCQEVFTKVDVLFETTTLADMVKRAQDAGLKQAGYEGFVYVI